MCGKDGRPVVGVVDVKKEPFDDALGVMERGYSVGTGMLRARGRSRRALIARWRASDESCSQLWPALNACPTFTSQISMSTVNTNGYGVDLALRDFDDLYPQA